MRIPEEIETHQFPGITRYLINTAVNTNNNNVNILIELIANESILDLGFLSCAHLENSCWQTNKTKNVIEAILLNLYL